MAKMLRMKPYNFVWELRRGREDSLSTCIGETGRGLWMRTMENFGGI
jgi:hypothetical protein